MASDQGTGKGIESDGTLFDIVELLRELDGAGVTELADRLDVAKSTVHAHLTTLRDRGFAVKRAGEYELGLRFFEYGQYARSRLEVVRSGVFAVDELEAETGEMVWLLTHQHGKAIYVYGRAGDNAIDVNTILGTWVHMHCNSGGKAILAHLPTPEAESIIDTHGLPARTEQTITDRERLLAELGRIEDRGYALNLGEDLEGIHAVGVPLVVDGEVQGALSVAGPAHRMPRDRCGGAVLDRLRAATDEIDLTLAYR